VYFQLLMDSAWRSEPANVSSFLESWGTRRCGRDSMKVRQAWRLLGETVYAASAAQHYEHHMAYCSTGLLHGGTWDTMHGSEHPSWYNTSSLYTAWGLLIEAAKSECAAPLSKAFIFDLVDVGREYLSIAPCMTAYSALGEANSTQSVAATNSTMTTIMSDIDRLLGSSDGFLLGSWVSNAREVAIAAGAPQDADFLEWNARAQVTSWSPADAQACNGQATALSALYDYGNKAWSGLVKGYYDRRYQIFAQSKLCKLEPSASGCDGFSYFGQLMKLACDFQHSTAKMSAKAVGDAVAISEELFAKYQ
jgi:alpha-N-acetylglucosaminidase